LFIGSSDKQVPQGFSLGSHRLETIRALALRYALLSTALFLQNDIHPPDTTDPSRSTMTAITLRLNAFGPLENTHHLTLEPQTLPTPSPTEVLVDLHAASLNYRDLMTVLGTYNPNMALPRTPGSDASGIVTAIGTNVTRFNVGDHVTSLFFQNWLDGPIQPTTAKSALGDRIDGVFSTAHLFPETGLIHAPSGYTHAEAATLPCAALTAWNALIEKGNLHAGQTVLIQGTGGVSLFALQFAKAHGARVILTSSSDEKLARARELGADETINYRTTPDWELEVFRLTHKQGVDHIVEVGGAGTLPRSFKAITPGGRIYVIGVLAGKGEGIDPTPILAKAIQVSGISVGSRAMHTRMIAAIEANQIHPILDRTFPLTQTREALTYLQSGNHFGKIVLSLRD
jgi:NADPH:quinone reductase-like Zn-dependent oxidoreductase